MASQPQQQRRQGVSVLILTTSLKLGEVAGNWDDKLLLPPLDPGWMLEKRMRSGLQKQHRLRKGRTCQATFPWSFSITSLSLVSHFQKPVRDTRESHKQWILKKCMCFIPSCWKIPMCQEAEAHLKMCKHLTVAVCFPLSPTTSSCLKTGVFFSFCPLTEMQLMAINRLFNCQWTCSSIFFLAIERFS